ncbi:MAG: hypothetical protein JRI52_10570 [Deltaproteobacteria bacterium]|nr:hypothetical protein [Deltaproteobacteria bacterium]
MSKGKKSGLAKTQDANRSYLCGQPKNLPKTVGQGQSRLLERIATKALRHKK